MERRPLSARTPGTTIRMPTGTIGESIHARMHPLRAPPKQPLADERSLCWSFGREDEQTQARTHESTHARLHPFQPGMLGFRNRCSHIDICRTLERLARANRHTDRRADRRHGELTAARVATLIRALFDTRRRAADLQDPRSVGLRQKWFCNFR